METEKRIIEVNGVKLEIDLRNAKVIDSFKIGDPVKILIENYANDYSSYLGIIVGFDDFEKTPTIVVAYLKVEYSEATIKFAYINSKSKQVEICPINEWDVPFSKQSVLDKMDREIAKKTEEIRELESKKFYFLNMFGKYFESIIATE